MKNFYGYTEFNFLIKFCNNKCNHMKDFCMSNNFNLKVETISKFNKKISTPNERNDFNNNKTTKFIWCDDPVEKQYEFYDFSEEFCEINDNQKLVFANNEYVGHVIEYIEKDVLFSANDNIFMNKISQEKMKMIKSLVNLFFDFCNQMISMYSTKFNDSFKTNFSHLFSCWNVEPEIYLQEPNIINRFLTHLKSKSFSANKFKSKCSKRITKLKALINKIFVLKTKKCYTVNEIADICGISKSNYYAILRKQKTCKDSKLRNSTTKIVKTILSSNELQYIKALLDDPFSSFTVPKIRENIFEKFGTFLSISTIAYHIKHTLRYSYKRSRFKNVTYFNPPQKIIEYKTIISLMDRIREYSHIIYIDETGFSTDIYKEYSYSPLGQISYKAAKRNAGRLNLIMGITMNKILAYQITTNSINKFSFVMFIKNLICRFIQCNSYNAGKIVLFMDRSKVHKSKLAQQLFQLLPCDIFFNSPYSPQYNIIETVFGMIKKKVKTNLILLCILSLK